MILARSPLRITLGGGGTDLPSYYRDHGACVLSAAIDQYVFVGVNRSFLDHLLIRYSRIEEVARRQDVRHPIIREALDLLAVEDPNLEITTMADIPAGTGLGSSGSFATALLAALTQLRRRKLEPHALAEMACHIEMERLGESVGKQDPYAAAYGGLTRIEIDRDGQVRATALEMAEDASRDLEERLLLFSTGLRRSASAVLRDQHERTLRGDRDMMRNLHEVRDIGDESRAALEAGDLDAFGRLLDRHWQLKKRRSAGISNAEIDAWYRHGMAHGAYGGKLIGAGAGGFLMFYAPEPARLRRAMAEAGLAELRFAFEYEGTKILH